MPRVYLSSEAGYDDMLDRARITVPTLVTNVWKPRYEDHFAFMVVLRVGIIPSEAAPKIRNPSWTVNLGIRCFGHNIQVTRLRTVYVKPALKAGIYILRPSVTVDRQSLDLLRVSVTDGSILPDFYSPDE